MNKRNFVFDYVMKKSDFDNLQGDVEGEFNNVASGLYGKSIVRGLDVTISGAVATVSAGLAFDGEGKRIKLEASEDVSLGDISRPESDKFKWITLVAEHTYEDSGTLVDGNNQTWAERLIDDCSLSLVEGTAAAENSATKPTIDNDKVSLVDIKVDHDTAWASLNVEKARRPSPLPSLLELVYPVGYTYAQYPGGLTPSAMLWPGTWEAQFEEEGVFFRTPGGRALGFGVGIQRDANKSHRHLNGIADDQRVLFVYGSSRVGTSGSTIYTPESSNTRYQGYSSHEGGNESRPLNRTFRIWKRTA